MDILVVFRPDLSPISFNLVKNALTSQQLGFLGTRIAFGDILTQACAEIKILRFALLCRSQAPLGRSL